MGTKYKPRLTIEITEDQSRKLNKILDYGVRKAIFSALIDDLCNLYKNFQEKALVGILQKTVRLRFVENSDELAGTKAVILGTRISTASRTDQESSPTPPGCESILCEKEERTETSNNKED